MSDPRTQPAAARPGRVGLLLGAAGLLLGGGCSVANMTHAEVLRELDSFVRVEGTPPQRQMVYLDQGEVMPWYMRFTLFYPLRPLLRVVPGGAPAPTELANPPGHARELMHVIGHKAGAGLLRCADTTLRLVPVVELDGSTLNRIAALRAVETMTIALDLSVACDLTEADAWPTTSPREAEWIAAFRAGRPAARALAQADWDPQAARTYREALLGLSARPMAQSAQRLALVAELADALREETESELREPTAAALRGALHHCLRWTVIDAMAGQSPALVELRLLAASILHRQGGVDSVPMVLALMAATAEQVRDGMPRFDPDPYVRRRLIHLCGQLDARRAAVSVRLPRMAAWEPIAPIDFLAEVILKEDPYYSGLRTVAQEALCRCLGRPIDYDLEWVRVWYAERQRAS